MNQKERIKCFYQQVKAIEDQGSGMLILDLDSLFKPRMHEFQLQLEDKDVLFR